MSEMTKSGYPGSIFFFKFYMEAQQERGRERKREKRFMGAVSATSRTKGEGVKAEPNGLTTPNASA